jgi:GT2 family glycosyltransferase
VRYLLIDGDVSRGFPGIDLGPEHDGVGIIIRWRGTPIGFVLHRVSSGTSLSSDDVARLLDQVRDTRGAPEAASIGSARTPSLTAVVCTRDRPEKLARCLASLRALASTPAAARTEFQILVVDNAPSDDRTRDLVAALPDVRYVRAPVEGLDFARNCALHEAHTDFVAFFDDDVTVDAGWLEGFVEAMAANSDAAAVTGPVLPYELATRAQILFEEYGGFGHRFEKLRHETSHPSDPYYPCRPGRIGTGCNMALRRSTVEKLGGFDVALDTGAPLPGGGDLDMIYRIIRAGHPIATEPRCLVFHEHRRSYEELRRQMWTWGLGFMAFVTKSYRTDPVHRPKFRRMVVRWFGRRIWQLALAATGRIQRPVGLAAAQLGGGIVGLFGEYSRSERRVRRLVAAEAPSLGSRPEQAT